MDSDQTNDARFLLVFDWLRSIDARVDALEVKLAGYASLGGALGASIPVIVNLLIEWSK